MVKRELHQLDLTKNQNLELVRNRFHRKELSGPKVASACVVDQNVEVTSFRERSIECIFDRKPIGQIEKYPRLKAWAEVLMRRPSTHSFPEAEFEALYRLNVKRRNKWISQFVADAAIAAE